MKTEKAAIVIPIYKSEPTSTECLSFRQSLKVLSTYDFVIVSCEQCNLSIYMDIAKKHQAEIKIEMFDKDYFQSVSGYNRLMLSPAFYHRFERYEYILIYQLDAFVFSNQLEEWCAKGYDYIGAPIHFRDEEGNITDKVWGVGNGGFSLRRVSYCHKLLSASKSRPFMNLSGLMLRYKMHWHTWLGLLPRLLGQKNTLGYFLRKNINEDLLFSVYAAHSFLHAKVPDTKTAREFAIESKPSAFFAKPDEELPFGCHAFEKNEYDSYWKPIISRCS